MLIHRVTRCLPQPTRYGGRNRSDQIAEALRSTGATVVELDFFSRSARDRLGNLRAGFAAWRRLPAPFARTYRHWWALGRFVRLLRAAAPAGGTLAWENTDDLLLGWAARHLGWRLLAFPHNLNALYNTGPSDSATRMHRLAREIAALGWADAVFTIAPDENNFLRLAGIPAELLPYRPAADFRAELAAIRAQRHPAPDAPILILGSANNAHTREGIVAQLGALVEAPTAIRHRIIVGGDATDRLAADYVGLGFRFAGRIPAAHLDALLPEIAALWIVQDVGTGVVTRVRDFTLAGIPVVANSVAARSWEHTPGVVVLDDPAGIGAVLAALPEFRPENERPPELPANVRRQLARLGIAPGVTGRRTTFVPSL